MRVWIRIYWHLLVQSLALDVEAKRQTRRLITGFTWKGKSAPIR